MQLVVTIEKLISRGEGLARHDGKVVLIPFVLPGEEVQIKITERKKEYDRGYPLKILKPSSYRVSPKCLLFQRCGGCQWLHIRYSEQLHQKQLMVQEAFLRIGKLEILLPEIISGPSLEYRNRVQIQENMDGVRGFMESKKRNVVPVSSCPILYPTLNSIFEIKSEVSSSKKTLIEVSGEKKKHFQNHKIYGFGWSDFVATYDSIPGKVRHREKKKFVKNKEQKISPEIKVNLLGKTILFDLNCFFQSNLELLPKMIRYILSDYCGKNALDLYCGVGLFATFLSDYFDRVIAIEENSHSMTYAKKNILLNKKAGQMPILISESVEYVQKKLPKIDFAVVDPPRIGLTKRAKDFILRQNIPQLVYVSCDPVTLARDLRELLDHGYSIQKMKLFDFYPQTFHIESVVHLIKSKE